MTARREWMPPMLEDTRHAGLLHLCNSGACTWQEYRETTLAIAARLGLPVKTTHVAPLSRPGFPGLKAERPEHTAFDLSRYISLSGTAPRPWQEALEEYLTAQYQA